MPPGSTTSTSDNVNNSRPPIYLIERLREHARAIPGNIAIRAPGGALTFAQLAERAEHIAGRLRVHGCRPGDRVAIIGKPSLEWIEVLIGAAFARLAFAPISTMLTTEEHHRLLADARPAVIFADGEIVDAGSCSPDITIRLGALDEWMRSGPVAGEPQASHADDLFSIIYSSGTTGVPKGIAHTVAGRMDFVRARQRPSLGPGKFSYVSTSLYTNLSFLGIVSPLYWGAGIIVPERFTPGDFLRSCREDGITDVGLVPVQVRRILDHPEFAPDALASLEFTMISGSPIDLAVKRRLIECWPGKISDGYGSTETGGIAMLDLKAHPDKLDTVGPIMAGVEVRILDEDGVPLPQGEIGEIAAGTPLPMEGYFNRKDLTEGTMWADSSGSRFIKTGDTGYLGEDGFLRITGRSRDMIISGGLNIFAIDIEEALLTHPAVLEVAVIAVPSEQWGESPHAIVVLKQGVRATGDELTARIATRLSRTSWPVGYSFVDELPRNALGKVLKRELREPFWAGRERDVA